MNKTVPKRD